MSIHPYCIRCRPERVPELLALGVLLGVLVECEAGHAAAPGIVWDPIGPVHRPTGQLGGGGQPLYEPVRDADGTPLWHANVFTPFPLLERAQQVARDRPEVAQALAAVPDFFVTGADGRAAAPRRPARVLFGMPPETL